MSAFDHLRGESDTTPRLDLAGSQGLADAIVTLIADAHDAAAIIGPHHIKLKAYESRGDVLVDGAWPDNWSRWQRALDDTFGLRSVQLDDLAE